MIERFKVIFLREVRDYIAGLDPKTRKKIIFNMDKARYVNDPKIFKKLTDDIWEFRTRFGKKQYRLLAFWDKSNHEKTLIIASHGFIKKTDKVPAGELRKAKELMAVYFKQK